MIFLSKTYKNVLNLVKKFYKTSGHPEIISMYPVVHWCTTTDLENNPKIKKTSIIVNKQDENFLL